MNTKISALVGIGIMSVSPSLAENARFDAMGGISIIDDFSHVLYFPGSVNDFPDQIKGTMGTYSDTAGKSVEYFGPILGKKSIGKILNVGFIANTQDQQTGSGVLRSNFYNRARSFLRTYSADTLPSSFPAIPHVLLGLDFDKINLGFEGFYEEAHFKRLVASTNSSSEQELSNVGVKASATIALGKFWLCPLFGIGAPSLKATTGDTAAGEIASTKSKYMTAGLETGIEWTASTFVMGAFFTNEAYRFGAQQSQSPDYNIMFCDMYAGYTTWLLDSLFLAVEYDLSLQYDDVVNTGYEFHDSYIYHGFHLGVERPFKVKGLFDAVIPRAGIAYTIGSISEKPGDTVIVYPADASTMQLNSGIGFKKDVFQLDLFVNIGNWNGVLTGPRTMAVTLTIGLSREFLEK
jgi:hypothetical protein